MRKNYLWYQFFRYGIVKGALHSFYSRLTVSGTEHIPSDSPVLFIPNHQNSFLDALHVVCNTNLFIHFLTRSDLFEVPVLNGFLKSLNMLPVYRMRDGFGSIKDNEPIFDECIQYIGRGDSILIFAEANHDMKRRVRPLSKGFTRIAFGAEEKYNWELGLQVIPVGINYGDHRKSREPVHVAFGEGITVSDYKEEFTRDSNNAARLLKEATSTSLKKLTMHVPNLNHYPFHKLLLDDLEPDRSKLLDPALSNRRVSIIEGRFEEELMKDAIRLNEEAGSNKVDLKDFISVSDRSLKRLFFNPFRLFSLVNNVLPYLPIRWITRSYIEDHVFDASAKFLSALILFPIFYVLIGASLSLLGTGPTMIAGYISLSIFTVPMFVKAKDMLKKSTAKRLERDAPGKFRSIHTMVKKFVRLRKELLREDQLVEASVEENES